MVSMTCVLRIRFPYGLSMGSPACWFLAEHAKSMTSIEIELHDDCEPDWNTNCTFDE